MSLKTYEEKRDFQKTAEPAPRTKSSENERIFVIQKHDASRLHYDFRLEWEGVLLSWAVPKGPSFNPKDKRLAVEVEPHPYDYKDFEGTIPEGEYGGGTVMIWDFGTWEEQPDYPFAEGLKKGALKFVLKGERLKGKWALIRIKSKSGEEDKPWLLIKEHDDYEQGNDGISGFVTSALSGRSMEEIAKAEQMRQYTPTLAVKKNRLPQIGYSYELKYDGYRILAYVDADEVKLVSRNGIDYTEKFPKIKAELQKLQIRAVIDGEIVVFQDNKSNFSLLQKYLKTAQGSPVFMAFDLLYFNKDLTEKPLVERRELLQKILPESPSVRFSRSIGDGALELLPKLCEDGYEGIIAKKNDSPYRGERTEDWIKVKCQAADEFHIIGYSRSEKAARAFSSLLLARREGESWQYVGKVGTGFSEDSAADLLKRLKSLERQTPVVKIPAMKEEVHYLEPLLIAEVNYQEMTADGMLRQASFKGLREDKMDVVLTSPKKPMIGEITKDEIFHYYSDISERMLPFVKDRLLSLLRCPDGIDKACFFQKHLEQEIENIKKKQIEENDGDKAEYFFLSDSRGLLSLVQYGSLEFHIWGSKIHELEKPDMMVFDLDPDEGLDLGAVRQGVRDLKAILDELGLKTFLKTSGGKGYHLVVPLKPEASWEKVAAFAKNVALLMEQKYPDRYTSNMRKEKRKGKIYVDWVRNRRSSTSVAPYSLRARDSAGVSFPIRFEDLERVGPADITIYNALQQTNDPWKDFFNTDQSLE